jgi:hypothetical protein
MLSTVIFAEFAVMVTRSPIMMRDMEWDEFCFMVTEPRQMVYLGWVGVVSIGSLLTVGISIQRWRSDHALSPLDADDV